MSSNKNFILLMFFMIFSSVMTFGQTAKIHGKILDETTESGVSQVSVQMNNLTVLTDGNGKFEFDNIPFGKYTLTTTSEHYQQFTMNITVDKKELILEPIILKAETQEKSLGTAPEEDENITTISDLENDNQQQNISATLTSRQDVITSSASYNLGFARFSYRGYASEYSDVYINGLQMNNPETERPVWSEWGGLNDAMRNQETYFGLEPGTVGLGNLSGMTSINCRPIYINKQQKFTYAASNRSYNNRLTYTYSSGLLKNNWAFAANVSKRWAKEGYVDGTWYDAWSAFFTAEKRLNDRHSITMTAFATPYNRGMQSAATQEAFELNGSNYYNPNWGWQMGEKRNAKVRKLTNPTFMFNHLWTPSKKLKLNNAVGFIYSDLGTTGLNWYDAPDPRPDYYRYLPSYQTDTFIQQLVSDAWKTDDSKSQIDWDKLYQVNYLQNLEGKQAKYIVEERKTVSKTLTIQPSATYNLNSNYTLRGGILFQSYNGEYYKVINDLLGGQYWIDVDQFAERDFAGDTAVLINDLLNPNKQLKENDIYGYDYILRKTKLGQWASIKGSFNKFDFYAGYDASFLSYSREGKMKNGRYPDNSLGKSEKLSFSDFICKGGLIYKISGKDFININAGYFSVSPSLNDVFLVPTISNLKVSNLENESILSGDISYIRAGRKISGKLSVYQTYFNNQMSRISFYHDDLRTYVDLTQTGIDKVHQGIEAGVSAEIFSGLKFNAYTNIGNYVITSRPLATISYQNGSKPDTSKVIYSKYFFESSSPQIGFTAGFRYNSPKFWFANIYFNYIDKNYLSFNPERRTEKAIENLGPDDPMIDAITAQTKLESGYTLDVSLGKSWRLKNKNMILLHFSVNNILNNTNIITSGFEQMRFDFENKNISKFPPKYFYAYGINYFAMITYRF